MKKRFLHVCKNPACKTEFAVLRSAFLHDKSGEIRIRCPCCKKLQKIESPVKKKKKESKIKNKKDKNTKFLNYP